MTDQRTLPDEVQSDAQALIAALSRGTRVDEATRQRIRERANKVRDELKEQHGALNIAVDLIRQSRDDV